MSKPTKPCGLTPAEYKQARRRRIINRITLGRYGRRRSRPGLMFGFTDGQCGVTPCMYCRKLMSTGVWAYWTEPRKHPTRVR
jgi:hypothetical protein